MSALRKLVDLLKIPRSERDSKEKSITDQYTIENSGLYRLVEEGGKATKLYVIPSPIRKSVVVRYHDLAVHFSLDRTLRGIKQRNWFPRRQHTRSCIECFFTKTPGGRIPGKLHNMPPGERPFSIIHMDHMGPTWRKDSWKSQLKPYNNDDTLTKTREKTVTMKEVRRKKTRTQKIQNKSEKKLKSHGHGTDDCQPTYKTMK
ncbi:Integrase zinc binding domain [Popillia japonica]|uniref:Integrase zinc binding domain n=1 Tax=Popillia japonica TaxID=7064 RepID=A0AAW1MEH1_POPJA